MDRGPEIPGVASIEDARKRANSLRMQRQGVLKVIGATNPTVSEPKPPTRRRPADNLSLREDPEYIRAVRTGRHTPSFLELFDWEKDTDITYTQKELAQIEHNRRVAVIDALRKGQPLTVHTLIETDQTSI